MVADGVTPARAQSAAEVSGQTPQPGLTGYVQGRFRFYGAIVSQDGDSAPFVAAGPGGTPPARGGKLANYDFFEYGRIWVGADGVAANGLRYGARLEIRMPYPATNTARGDDRGTLFFRRAVGYVGTPTLGQLRFGSGTVQAVEQMYTGHMMGKVASGLLDGEFSPAVFVSGANAAIGFTGVGLLANSFFYSSSTVNNASAIGYYSPQFFGFDIGLSYAPNDGNLAGICGPAGAAPNPPPAALAGCDQASSSARNAGRLRNQFDAMLRYRGTFGPVGLTASGGFRTADTVDDANPAAARFKRVTAGIFGAELTWAGLTVGGITTFGPYNRGFTALQKNEPRGQNRDAFSWQLGAAYTIGAITVGAAYHELRTEGERSDAPNPVTGKLKEQGFGVGASYALAPGLALFAEYIYSKVSESGRDFIDNTFQAGRQESFKASVGLLGIGIQW
jgi:predicted porin